MPTLDEMKCVICEEIKPKDELVEHEGLCADCASAMETAERTVDTAENGDREEVSLELQAVVTRAKKRKFYMSEYNSRPLVAAKRKEYMKGRYEKEKALLAKAKEAGLL
jgi:hypothetical protein